MPTRGTSMFLKALLGVVAGVWLLLGLLTAAVTARYDASQGTLPPPLLLVSFDGFRADYLKKFPMINLKRFYSQGVLVEELNNIFITKTFPNHYTLVTGLYAESHGIVSSDMYDPLSRKHFTLVNDTDPMWWSQAEPLWVTAQRYGYKTATAMWPGSDAINRTGTYFLPYNQHTTFKERLGSLIKWIEGNDEEEGVMFAALYWEEPDMSGHKFGPDNTTAMSSALKEVDDSIGLLMSELEQTGLWGRINVVITSDHGMAQCSPDRVIRLDDCLHPDNYTALDLSPVASIIPLTDPEAVYALLKKCHPRMVAYLKKDIPARLHYKNNNRIQPILLIADEGWTIIQRGNKIQKLGDHGYDNLLPSMHPFMAASGPSFRQSYKMKTLQSVDLYPLMCYLLQIPAQPNNGTLSNAKCLLVTAVSGEGILAVSLVVGMILFIVTVAVLFRYMRGRRHLRSFQRLQMSDDIAPLLD
eukprot:XP_011604475.1 PREDICTED: bis(5'-adenosyl)-triphosphatase enpp4-like isoform X1 [Takifugu rubripes]